MPEFIPYREYELQVGDRNPQEGLAIGLMEDSKMLERVRMGGFIFPISPQVEANGISRQNAVDASGSFHKNRAQVRDDLRAIVGFAIDRYKIPMGKGMDVGSGMTGDMVEALLPISGNSKKNWSQLEINPDSVAENMRRHPDSDIRQGSYLVLSQGVVGEKLPVITGLSSFDATCFLEHAVTEVRKTLEDGGFFFHLQDVRPGNGGCIQQLRHEGITGDINVLRAINSVNSNGVVAFENKNMMVSGGEMFRRRLGRAITQDGQLELLVNDWITARKPLPDTTRPAKLYFMNSLIGVHPSFMPFDSTAAVVTVARKRNA